jgi:hypothetical protein
VGSFSTLPPLSHFDNYIKKEFINGLLMVLMAWLLCNLYIFFICEITAFLIHLRTFKLG